METNRKPHSIWLKDLEKKSPSENDETIIKPRDWKIMFVSSAWSSPRKSHWSDFPGKSRQMRAKSSKVETSERNLAHGHQIECRDRSSWCPKLAHFQDDSFICSRTSFQLAHKISIPNGSYLTEPFWKSEWIESVPLMTTYYFNCLAT